MQQYIRDTVPEEDWNQEITVDFDIPVHSFEGTISRFMMLNQAPKTRAKK